MTPCVLLLSVMGLITPLYVEGRLPATTLNGLSVRIAVSTGCPREGGGCRRFCGYIFKATWITFVF